MYASYYEKPFDELLPVMSQKIKNDVHDIYDTFVKINCRTEGLMARINVRFR